MKKKFLMISMMLIFALTAMAQNVGISGKVVDANGEPLVGVSILVQGTTTGTMTDVDGNFALDVPADGILEVSSIGFMTQTFAIGERRTFDITLEEDAELLEGTVVVGYGTVKRTNFTGSVTTYKVSDSPLANTMPSNALELLRGAATGLTMSQSGVAGSSPNIMIRGQKSINGGSQPLIVRDGVIFQGSIQDIDPDTIESMSVMKDATSLAAYGSQAANGVIMITTKKGQVGKPVINFRGTVALVEQNFTPEFMDGYEYIRLVNARKGNYDNPDDVSWMSALEKANYDAGKQTDWVDYVSRTGVRQNYSFNISGATEKVNYMVGASWADNTNFIKGNKFKRGTVTGRVNTNITKNISAGVDFNYSQTNNVAPRVSYMDTRITPWGSPTLSDGVTMRKYVDDLSTNNPLWNVYNGYDNETKGYNVNLGANLEIKFPFLKGLSYRLAGNMTRGNSKTMTFRHENNFVTVGLGEAAYTTEEFDKNLNVAGGSISHSENLSWVLDNILTYTREFGKHYVNATFVYTRDSRESSTDGMSGEDFSGVGNTTLGAWGLNNAGTITMNSITYSLHTDVGYLGRVNYSFADKYHINASIRRDGSSVFGSDNKWGWFPAVGGAWTISDEDFMNGAKSWLDYLKLKVSWGKNGNQSLSPYGTLSRMAVGRQADVTYFFGDTPAFGQTMLTLGNPNLGWETTTSFNYGFEIDMFQRRLHLEVDAYNSKTTDQIFNRIIPVMGTGLTRQQATMGQVDNWGIEAALRAGLIQKKQFNWTANLNFTINRNKLVDLYGDGEDDITNNLFLGHSLGAIYGYRWDGIIQQDDTEYMEANGGKPGHPKFADLDGDGKITVDDREILGYNKESFRMSLSSTMTWKNWSLYFLFNGVFSGGKYGLAENKFAYVTNETMPYNNMFRHPYWTPDNPSDIYPSAEVDDTKLTALQPYGFVRLQDLNLSYNFKAGFLSKLHISSLQLYVSGKNLFFIAPGWDFSDPEVRNPRSQQLARTYTFGVNVRF